MRIGVFSDSHGDWEALDSLLEQMGYLNAACFLGDVARDAQHLQDRLSVMPGSPALYAVRGNNDYSHTCMLPWDRVIELGGVRIYMEHGHRSVSLASLSYKAQEKGAGIAMFGHTHQAYQGHDGYVFLLNPGSAGNTCRGGRARACMLEISRGKYNVTEYFA